jgi:hypothetical protein
MGNFLRRETLHRAVRCWTLTTLREKPIKIGAKVVRHARRVVAASLALAFCSPSLNSLKFWFSKQLLHARQVAKPDSIPDGVATSKSLRWTCASEHFSRNWRTDGLAR